MSDGKGGPNKEPSMDDILASIRKIISDDEARAQGAGPRPAVVPPAIVPPTIVPPTMTSPSRTASNEDVLLLTDIVEEPEAMSNVEPANPAEMPQPSAEQVPPPKADALVGAGVAGVASSAFARLNQAVQDSVPAPAATNPGPSVGGQTIEELVKEMLRPMLKDWLDTNLPPMVERYVEREIARLTRR